MAELSEEIIGKLVAMAESFQDVKQQVQQVSQDSQQAVQAAKSVSQEITALKGSLSSDFVSRFLSAADVDQGDDEQRRADQALGFGGRVYKHNIYDLGKAADLNRQDTDFSSYKEELQQQHLQMTQASLDHYKTILSDERVAKDNIRYYGSAKIQQEQRHADIATEDQWESEKEALVAAIVGEVVKSIQVPPAANEGGTQS